MAVASRSPHVRTYAVPATARGMRLDKWLAAAAKDTALSRSRLQALISGGAVTVAGTAVSDAAHRLKGNETVTIAVPPPEDPRPAAQDMALDVVYEDDDLIVVDKPAGLVVHPAPGNPDRTLVNALLAHCGETLRGIGGVRRPGIVHRLDKDTSGLLVIAKTEAAHAGLSAQFARHSIERTYQALVWGVPRPGRGTITDAIGRSPHNRKKMAVVKRGGRHAETGYQTLAAFGGIAAHVQCRLKTGRTHQIRVHMASIGHPLIGDPVYGGSRGGYAKALPEKPAAVLRGFHRQALHAASLGFIHPVSGKKLAFDSLPPKDFKALMAALEDAGG